LPEGYPALEDLIWSGRRNISPAQRAYLMGKMYKETKKEQGGDRGNQYTAPKGNNFPLPTTAERIAEQFNVSDRTGAPCSCLFTGRSRRGRSSNTPGQTTRR